MSPEPVYRAPMRARDRDAPPCEGAAFGLDASVVGIGDGLPEAPGSLEDAVRSAAEAHGAKAARMLERFAGLADGSLVWTRAGDDAFHLGRIAGPWRYDDSREACATGIHHVRPARWIERPFAAAEIPPAVEATFARGGRNLQRMNDRAAERGSAELWERWGR